MILGPAQCHSVWPILLKIQQNACRYMNKLSNFPGKESLNITMVGMSATVPNLGLLASWLDAEHLQTDFRFIDDKFNCFNIMNLLVARVWKFFALWLSSF